MEPACIVPDGAGHPLLQHRRVVGSGTAYSATDSTRIPKDRIITSLMAAFKLPTFQDRQAAAAKAKSEALAKLRDKPPVDEAAVAARAAKRQEKEAAAAAKREAQRLAREQAAEEKRARAAQAAEQEAAAAAKVKPVLTPEEQKAARDARYAARKQRKSGK